MWDLFQVQLSPLSQQWREHLSTFNAVWMEGSVSSKELYRQQPGDKLCYAKRELPLVNM
jgi:hypothetical protein